MFSRASLTVFSELLNGYALPASHPNFEQVASAISIAKQELDRALADPPTCSDEPRSSDPER